MAFQNVGTFDLGTVGGQSARVGNAQNFAMDNWPGVFDFRIGEA